MNDLIQFLKTREDYIGSNGRNKSEIEQAEKELDTTFADDYKHYLEKIGLASFDGHELTGLTKDPRLSVVSTTREKRQLVPDIDPSWYLIEDAYIDGILIWQDPHGSIFMTSPNSNAKKIAESLAGYAGE